MAVWGTFCRSATVANCRLDITQCVDRVAENRRRPICVRVPVAATFVMMALVYVGANVEIIIHVSVH